MLEIFTIGWNPETGEIRCARSMPLEIAQQLIVKLMADEVAKQSLAKAAEEKAGKKKGNKREKDG